MKTIKITSALVTFALCITMIACGSPEKKVEKAEDNVEEAKEDVQEAKEDLNEAKQNARQDSVSEYTKYKADAEEQLIKNEQKLAELWAKKLKEDITKAQRNSYKASIDGLDKRNKELKAKLTRQDDPARRTQWQNFKAEFDRDMDELDKSIKDFIKDNKR